jgi:3-oxoacyl-(acyl-carrier-protein) synthase
VQVSVLFLVFSINWGDREELLGELLHDDLEERDEMARRQDRAAHGHVSVYAVTPTKQALRDLGLSEGAVEDVADTIADPEMSQQQVREWLSQTNFEDEGLHPEVIAEIEQVVVEEQSA